MAAGLSVGLTFVAILSFILGLLGLISPKITWKLGFLKSRAGIFGFYLLISIVCIAISVGATLSNLDWNEIRDNAQDSRVAHLDSVARAIPNSDVEGNLRAYEELLTLEPENERYKSKVERYRSELMKKDSVSAGKSKNTDVVSKHSYRIVRDDRTARIKRSVEVRIDERLTKAQLTAIAKQIKSSDKTQYERTFISYLLPHEKSGEGCYATTHYDPDLKVDVYGATEAEYEKILGISPDSDDREVIGVWLDQEPMFTSKITLYRSNGTTYVESIYKDFDIVAEVREIQTESGIVYDNVKNPDVYRIAKNGNLQLLESIEGEVYEEYPSIE